MLSFSSLPALHLVSIWDNLTQNRREMLWTYFHFLLRLRRLQKCSSSSRLSNRDGKWSIFCTRYTGNFMQGFLEIKPIIKFFIFKNTFQYKILYNFWWKILEKLDIHVRFVLALKFLWLQHLLYSETSNLAYNY